MSVTAAGRLFHARDAATGNERSPRVDRRLGGTNSVGDAADRRRRRAATRRGMMALCREDIYKPEHITGI